MPPKKARIKDIARLAGVSIGTVDRVLHDRGEVADKTREKVISIAKELDYTPNFIAQALKTKKNLKIVTLLPEPTEDNAFWNKHPLGALRAIEELDPFPVALGQVNFDMTCENDFQKKADAVLTMNPDGIVLAPLFKKESISFCNKLARKGIPFVFIDGYLDETRFLSYTGEDIYQSGRVAGQLTVMLNQTGKDILIVNIARNLQNFHHLNSRTEGFLSYFPSERRNGTEIINLNIPDSDKTAVQRDLDRALNRNKDIGTVFVTGSKSFKVAEYIDNKGIKNINLIGYDIHERNVQYLKNGIIRFLIGQRPEEQTYKSVKKLFDFLSLNKVPEKIEYVPIDIVSSENVKFFE
jgi:LacI family transcriptional regulator